MSELAAAKPSFVVLDAATRKLVASRLRQADLTMVVDHVADSESNWYYHKGDLTLDGPVDGDTNLIVEGNLRIAGLYDDYRNDIGQLIVLGNFQVEHLISWGTIVVTGSIQADGLVYPYYNDFTFEVGGAIEARALVVSDKASQFNRSKVKVEVQVGDEGSTGAMHPLRLFTPDVMAPLVSNWEFDVEFDPDVDMIFPDTDACRKVLARGDRLFRKMPAPASLLSSLVRITGDEVEADVSRLIHADPMLAIAVACRGDLPTTLQDELIALKQPSLLRVLASNPTLDTERLRSIGQLLPSAMTELAGNPKSPIDMLVDLVDFDKEDSKAALLDRSDLTIEVLGKLAHDESAGIRRSVAYHSKARQLPTQLIERLSTDKEATVREATVVADGLLQRSQLELLANDSDVDVQFRVAEVLVEQKLWRRTRTLSDHEIESLAERLFASPEKRVSLRAVAALSAGQQLDAAKVWIDELKTEPRYQPVLVDIAGHTTSEDLMLLLLGCRDQEIRIAVASNLAITQAVQDVIANMLPSAKTRRRVSLLDSDALLRESESVDGVVGALLMNPNVSESTLLKLATYIQQGSAPRHLSQCVLEAQSLSDAVLTELRKVRNAEFLEEWSMSVLASPNASRANVERAIRAWDPEDEDWQIEARRLQRYQGVDWWKALAKSNLGTLRSCAAGNVHTPAESLRELIRSAPADDWDVRGPYSKNPAVTVSDKLLSQGPWVYMHPDLTQKQLEAYLLRERLADDPNHTVDSAQEVLAARKLRSK